MPVPRLGLTPPLLIALLGVTACSPGPSRPASPPAPDPITAVVGAFMWDGTGRAPVTDAVTLIHGDRVVCAGTAVECPVPSGAREIDARGRYLIPGLIDSHVHLLFLTNGSARADLALDLRNLLAQGITTVRDMGNDPAKLLARTRPLTAAPRVYAMQLVAGPRFFFNGFQARATPRGTVYRQPPALTMQRLGWSPILFNRGDDPDEVVERARKAGAIGLKLYAYLDTTAIRRLSEAAHRAGMPVWGHAWIQPASALEQALAGQDGVVHAAGLAGELFTPTERDSLVHDGDLQIATARVATAASARDPRILAALDTFARRGTFLEVTLDATRHSVAIYDAKVPHQPTEQEEYVRAAAVFGVEIAREAFRRGVRMIAGSDHVAYGPVGDRASLLGELELLVDSVGFSPTAALFAATRDAAHALGDAGRHLGTIQAGAYADLVLLSENPLVDIRNLESVEMVIQGGRIWRPGQLRSGIAMR